MRINIGYIVGIVLLFVSGSGLAAPRTSEQPLSSAVQVVSSDTQSIVLELTVADFAVNQVTMLGQTYDQIVIDGMTQTTITGAPQVPTDGAQIGVSALEGVSAQLLDVETESYTGYDLAPVPTLNVTAANLDDMRPEHIQSTNAPDPSYFATDAFYPNAPVELGEVGYMRDQAVAQIHFYPVQYNPVTKDLRLHRRMRVQVAWDAQSGLAATDPLAVSPDYENLLRTTLLNYADLDRPDAPTANLQGDMTRADATITDDPRPALKITTSDAGIYKLTQAALTDAGFDLTGTDPRTLKLTNRGKDIPIAIRGEGDGRFDADDYILFYGEEINDVYTNRNVYWLTSEAQGGQRIQVRNGAPQGASNTPTQFPATLHAEEDTFYWQTMPDGEGQDHWFWGDKLSAPASRDYTVSLRNIATTADTATVRVQLKGFTNVQATPDHHTQIYLNGTRIDDRRWDGQAIFTHEATVPHTQLQNGDNTLRVETRSISGVSVSQVLVNWIEIEYQDTYVAENDELRFRAPQAGRFPFNVRNFTSDDIVVFDVTNPASVVQIANPQVESIEGGRYRVVFEDTTQAATRYLALTADQYNEPADLELDTPSQWRTGNLGADYIVITHRDFYDSAERLAEHRAAMGFRVAVVDVADLYDEFNAGIFNPQAIRDFLAYAYEHWRSPAPAYVVLFGDAYQDYKDNRQTDTRNFVPSQIVQTDILGETPSDNWFVAVSGEDILPDMFIGRLSAQTVQQADDIVAKIIRYDQNPPDESWNTHALFVADDDEESFERMSSRLAAFLPDSYTTRRVDVDNYDSGSPTADIKKYINEGSLIINYAGHGQVDGWGIWQSQNFFDLDDARSLNNTDTLPVVTVANCLNGFFTQEKNKVSLAEELQRPNDTGAIAVWAATGLDYPTGHALLMDKFYETIFQDAQHDLGVATTVAKVKTLTTSGQWEDLVKTFILFGDPATSIGVPVEPPAITNVTPPDGATDVAVNQPLEIVFSKPMNPATVNVSGSGTEDLVPTLQWSNNYTTLTYAHTGFGYNETRAFTITGQDRQGNALDAERFPTSWSFTTKPLSDDEKRVLISGPVQGDNNVAYTFGAVLGFAGEDTTYTWQATDQEAVTHPNAGPRNTVTFAWAKSGIKTITVTATNAEGTFTANHQIAIGPVLSGDGGPIYLPIVAQ